MRDEWYSLRMRASNAGRHLSGAERIGRREDIPALTAALAQRALTHRGGSTDRVNCTIERLNAKAIRYGALPEVQSWQVENWQAGRRLAGRLLANAGVSREAVAASLAALDQGPGPGGQVMRGAMVVDAASGERLEPDQARGVRVSHMDVLPEERQGVIQGLAAAGLDHHRVLEALVLAGKVLQAPGLVAELCWSDDPEYLTGYVAMPGNGYQRICPLKEPGSRRGGRAFLVDRREWHSQVFVDFMEETPMLLHGPVLIHPPCRWNP